MRVTEIQPGMVTTDVAFNRTGDGDSTKQCYKDIGVCPDRDDAARAVVSAVQQPARVVGSPRVAVPISQR